MPREEFIFSGSEYNRLREGVRDALRNALKLCSADNSEPFRSAAYFLQPLINEPSRGRLQERWVCPACFIKSDVGHEFFSCVGLQPVNEALADVVAVTGPVHPGWRIKKNDDGTSSLVPPKEYLDQGEGCETEAEVEVGCEGCFGGYIGQSRRGMIPCDPCRLNPTFGYDEKTNNYNPPAVRGEGCAECGGRGFIQGYGHDCSGPKDPECNSKCPVPVPEPCPSCAPQDEPKTWDHMCPRSTTTHQQRKPTLLGMTVFFVGRSRRRMSRGVSEMTFSNLICFLFGCDLESSWYTDKDNQRVIFCPRCGKTVGGGDTMKSPTAQELERWERDLVRIYNAGYMSGHSDTVESVFVGILECDSAEIHKEDVEKLCDELGLVPPRLIARIRELEALHEKWVLSRIYTSLLA